MGMFDVRPLGFRSVVFFVCYGLHCYNSILGIPGYPGILLLMLWNFPDNTDPKFAPWVQWSGKKHEKYIKKKDSQWLPSAFQTHVDVAHPGFSGCVAKGFPFIVGVWGWTCVRVVLVVSSSCRRRQLEKALMFEKAKVVSMLEDTGIAWFYMKQQSWKHPRLWSLQVLLEGE